MPVRREARAVLLLPLLVTAVNGPPSATGLGADDPFGPLLGLIALLAWAVTGWLLLVLGLGAAERAGSRFAQVVLEQIAPTSLRSLVGVTVGAAVALAVAPPVSAEPRPSPAAELDLDWGQPVAAPAPSPVLPPRRSPLAVRPPVVLSPTVTDDVAHVVLVRPGDSLWRIAARALGPAATDRAVALAWPSWWRANRELIGTDPDLIQPGAALVPPSSPTA